MKDRDYQIDREQRFVHRPDGEEAGRVWAQHLSLGDHCQRCGKRYGEPSPKCVNYREHALVQEKETNIMTTQIDILDYAFDSDVGHVTMRQYFHKLLSTLWEEDEGFSGKRPFGNSGWQIDVYAGLVKGGYLKGEIDEHGDLLSYDKQNASKLVQEQIIDRMCLDRKAA